MLGGWLPILTMQTWSLKKSCRGQLLARQEISGAEDTAGLITEFLCSCYSQAKTPLQTAGAKDTAGLSTACACSSMAAADLSADSPGSCAGVPSHYNDADACCPAGGQRIGHLKPGRVMHAHQTLICSTHGELCEKTKAAAA